MKQVLSILSFLLAPLLFSCDSAGDRSPAHNAQEQLRLANQATSQQQPVVPVDASALAKDFTSWYNYTYTNIRLAQDFIGLNVDDAIIPKADFLKQLEAGKVIPVKTESRQGIPAYKLFRPLHMDNDVRLTLQQMAATEMEHLNMEGRTLPDYDFEDLSGRRYNKATTLGKTVIVKCWFINCLACVQEFPALNGLVGSLKHKEGLLFLSLASDNRQALSSFLKKKPFRYAVVPNQGDYMSEKLGISAYPTHLLVNRSGKIVKVTNSLDDMLPFIKKEIGTSSL